MREEYLKINEAAELLCLSVHTLYNFVAKNKIPYRKHGGKLVFCRAELEEWSRKQAS